MPVAWLVGRKLVRALLTLWFAVTVTFLLLRLLPGDPALALASPNMTAETRASILASYGLEGDNAFYAALEFWSAMHGFVLLEMTGAMHGIDTDAVFTDMMMRLAAGMERR